MEKPSINNHLYISKVNGEEKLNVKTWLDAGESYWKHILTLPVIRCEGWEPEQGKEYKEGVDFTIKTLWERNTDRNVPTLADLDTVAVPLPAAKQEEKRCVAGCMAFTGGEVKHHKDCPFYPGSLSELLDKYALPAANDGGEKERCEFENCIIKYFGLPKDADFNDYMRVRLCTLTDLLCAYQQSKTK